MPLVEDDDVLDVDNFATHHLPLDDATRAYEMFQHEQDDAIKVVFQPAA
jgi:threonine dehydrogenase-like Zn-dependent dehydrogenase